jgi:hypothetical protein
MISVADPAYRPNPASGLASSGSLRFCFGIPSTLYRLPIYREPIYRIGDRLRRW